MRSVGRAIGLLAFLTITPIGWVNTAFAVSDEESEQSGPLSFNRDVRPVLAELCFDCHGPDADARKAGLRFDIPNEEALEILAPGDLETSEFLARIFTHDEDDVMPPLESPRQPTAEQKETLRRWISEGAPYEKHWAFVAPSRSSPPEVKNLSWSRNEIDRFALAKLEKRKWSPRDDADPGILTRRLSLALTGLPPLPEQIDGFVEAHRENPQAAVENWVDQLLASPAYGEHLAWVWMDAARYADTNGYQGDGNRIMWPWRDWLIRSLNGNLPFDEMTAQMIAGDRMLPDELGDWESADWIADDEASDLLVATGFLRNHRYDTGSGTIPAESKFENATDRLETVGTVWMGLTMQCARCHTHKYDPIENREYYEMLSFFDRVPEVGSALKDASHPYIHTPVDGQRRQLRRLASEAEKASRDFEDAHDRIADEQRDWETGGRFSVDRVVRGIRHQYAKNGTHFDGTNAIEKTNEPISLCAGNREWTISFWFRPESGEDGAIFSSVEEPERYRPGIQADWIDGRIRVRHVCRWVNSYIEFESSERLELGKWHHVTFRCDGRMQGLAYEASLDGDDTAMQCTHPVTNDSAGNAGKAPLVLGGSPLLDGFVGVLRDLRFYDREIKGSEVNSLADPRPISEIVAIPFDRRSEQEKETLRLAFLESDAVSEEIAALQNAVFEKQKKLRDAILETPTTMVMLDSREDPTRVRLAGVYDSLGDSVSSAVPDFLPELAEENPDRLDLARWLVDPQHPLTARVAVNRIWQHLWGNGFVESPENFGIQTAEPIHAELLDWLATEYIRTGWDTKALIRLVVTSRTFQQSSEAPEGNWLRDPQNKYFSRGPRFRLPVSVVRDQALHLSGRLDVTVGGPPVLIDEVRAKNGKPVKLPYEKTDRRRTLYTYWKRNSPHPMLAVFDVADRNQCDVRIRRTNTPLQALVTLNEPGLARSAEALGERAVDFAKSDPERLRWLWRACTGREPTGDDQDLLRKTLTEYRTLANDEQAAWTLLANVMLNLDTTLTLE